MPPDRSGMRQMEEFVLKNRRSPLDIVKSKLDGLSPEQQEMLLRDALSRESTIPNAISQYEFAAVCDTYEGRSMLFWLMTRSTHPEITREEIDTMFEQATEEEFSCLLADWDKMVR